MPLDVKCPNPKCGCLLKGDTLLEGKQLPCPKCGTLVTVPEVSKNETVVMDTPAPDPMIGKKLGHYEILDKLGAGGMGTVYKARNISLDKEIALKVLPESASKRDRELVARFVREARSAAKLDHPNIATVYSAGRVGKYCFIEMQYLEGKSLEEVLSRKGRLSVPTATRIVLQVAQALQVAHKSGIIHRDIKPSNIILDGQGRPKVTDFGLARTMEADTRMTTAGQLIGTPDFMSPEQCHGWDADARSDIYSLGATYYKLLTGQVPFRGRTMMQVLMQHMDTPPPSPRDKAPDAPDSVCAILAKMMAKKPEDRYQNCQELISDLKSALPPASGGETEAVGRPKTLLYATVAAVLVAAVAVGITLVVLNRAAPQTIEPTSPHGGMNPPGSPSTVEPTTRTPAPAPAGTPDPSTATAPVAEKPKPADVPETKGGANTTPAATPEPIRRRAKPKPASTEGGVPSSEVKVPSVSIPHSAPRTPHPEKAPVGAASTEKVPPAAPSLDGKAFAKDVEDINKLVDAFDFERALVRLQPLAEKYPKEAKEKAKNIRSIQQFVQRAMDRIASGKVKLAMKDLSGRFGFAGQITMVDHEGIAAQKGKFKKRWPDLYKEEIYQLLRKSMGESCAPRDRVALALFLVEGTTDEDSLRQAENQIMTARQDGADAADAIAAIGLAREILAARTSDRKAEVVVAGKDPEREMLIEKLAPENRPLARRLLLHEKFDDNRQLWQQTEDESNRCMVEKGGYHLLSRGANVTRLRGTKIAHGDCILHASVRVIALQEAVHPYFGLCLRHSKTGSFYIYRIGSPSCSLTKIITDEKGSPAPSELARNQRWSASDFVGKTIEMEVVAAGPLIRCFLNGEMIMEATDPAPALAGEQIDACIAGDIELVVDDVIVFELAPKAGAQPTAGVAGKADRDKIIGDQMALKDEIGKTLSVSISTAESDHFMVHGDAPKTQLHRIARAGEKVYSRLCDIFAVGKKREMWSGKYVVLVFKDKPEYVSYLIKALHIKESIAEDLVSSPLSWKPHTSGFICFSPADPSDDLTETYYWYLSAYFLDHYEAGKPLPPWLTSGFREYGKKVLAHNPSSAERSRAEVKALVKGGGAPDIQTITGKSGFPPSDKDGRALCFSLVDYMLSQEPKRFLKLVDELKSGADQKTAFKAAFGKTMKEFESAWQAFVERKY